MNRLAHNKALITLLIVMLQVATLPGQGRLLCMLRHHSLECCCSLHAAARGAHDGDHGAGGCCAQQAAKTAKVAVSSCCGGAGPRDHQPPRAASLGDDETPTAPHRDCQCRKIVRHVGPLQPDLAGEPTPSLQQALLEPFAHFLPVRELLVGRFVTARVIPRARTGPPLHVLFGVFLI